MKTGKIVLKGKIKLLSPALIGSGRDERTDMDLIRDTDGRPFIPATSFTGVLRHSLKISEDKEKLKRFWGSEGAGEDYCQSAFYCNDLTISDNNFQISLRDGVAIDSKTGRAKDMAKFSFEVIERDTLFDLYIEIDLIEGHEEYFKRLLATIIENLQKERIRIGAKTTNGLGRLRLEDYQVFEFNFKEKDHLLKWLKGELPEPSELKVQPLSGGDNDFELCAYFTLKNSLLVRSYTGEPELPDAVHIKSANSPVLPGSSIKGAVRARAERIINTLGKSGQIIKELFGYVDEIRKDARKGKITIEEALLPDYPSEVQTRIKIDRFTGGVMEGALLETMPLFSDRKGDKKLKLTITITDCKDYEAGLMLLILKDLWTADLPVGGEKAIGRGVLEGREAEITYKGKHYKITEDLKVEPEEGKRDLEALVQCLANLAVKDVTV